VPLASKCLVWKVSEDSFVVIPAEEPRVSDNAYHCPGVLLVVLFKSHLLTDRIFSSEVVIGERTADHHDFRGMLLVVPFR